MAKQPKVSSEQAKRIRAVEKKIKPAVELEQNIRILIYGRSGAGKTRLGSTAPRPLLVDINDKGWDSVRRDFNPSVYPLDRWTELQDVYWYLAAGEHEHESVVLDNVTSMQTLCMKFVLGDEASRDASRDPDMPSRPTWFKVAELMKTQITNFRNLPMHIIFLANQRVREVGEEEEASETMVTPGCSPSIQTHLEQATALIGHLSSREVRVKSKKSKKSRMVVRRRLLVGPSDRYATKERYGVFPASIEAPNLKEMIREIYQQEE